MERFGRDNKMKGADMATKKGSKKKTSKPTAEELRAIEASLKSGGRLPASAYRKTKSSKKYPNPA